MEYDFRDIEARWQKFWSEQGTYRVDKDASKKKYYVLDMFPYPSGAGLHVGHPLGYIASDIFSRYKRLKGFNVLHPMGYDSFGLPAEQYAIQTGQHPAITTEQNIARYRQQMDQLGFCFDWDREVRTSEPSYYRWTQWIFLELFNSWYNPRTDRAEPIDTLVKLFSEEGLNISFSDILTGDIEKELQTFTAEEWNTFSEAEKREVLMHFRLAYLGEAYVNWCPAMGTVLANDEVINGVSERGGHQVERKLLKQWSMRITAYSQRLLDGLETLDWTESIKESQRNWIGRSEGASLRFPIQGYEAHIEVFTTRPDTVFGVSFVTLAPEHELVSKLTTDTQQHEVEAYVNTAKNRSERERMADVNTISGVFTGSYVTHPFTDEPIPIWVGDYVLVGYGTGAVMAVPAHDERDYKFAKHFGLPVKQVIQPNREFDLQKDAWTEKEGTVINSDFLNGQEVKKAIQKAIEAIEERGFGKKRINYRLRDAVFGRQRYWGEPIPIYYKEGVPYALSQEELPLTLPEVNKYLPTEDGEPPLARAKDWKYKGMYEYEHSTMPGWAGSSWYFLRYMDPKNADSFASGIHTAYWNQVDLYIGGAEHATGHLLYSRFWTKVLFDLGHISFQEPFQKMINQGMILGKSSFVYRINGTNTFVTFSKKGAYQTTPIHADISLVDNGKLDLAGFKIWRPEFAEAEFILEEDGTYICGTEDGVHNFLRKLWRLFHDQEGNVIIENGEASKDALKTLHKTIKKMQDDLERFSFNTGVSNFMICVNELSDQKCHNHAILTELVIMLSPYAPHISEELWVKLGHEAGTVGTQQFPVFNNAYLVESSFAYPVSFNGKMRFKVELSLELNAKEVEEAILSREDTQKWLEGNAPKKVIVVPGKIVNIVM
ncbi:MAG: leucine--tRNA ligase [Cryomorphaceae bacterium]|nr:leucine--tRNA ligase [Cryomorphaceae bacterium]